MSDSESSCADCGLPLSPDEVWVCSDCAAFYEMADPNHTMTGEHDG